MPSQGILHPLPSSGTLTLNDIIKEKGHPSGSNYTLKELATATDIVPGTGVGIALNEYDNDTDKIDQIQKTVGTSWENTPYAISDWYGYIQPHNIDLTEETQEIEFADVTLLQLVSEAESNITISEIDNITRLDIKQINTFNEARNNRKSGDSTGSTLVSEGELIIDKHSRNTSSLNTKVTIDVKRVVFRVNLSEFQKLKMQEISFEDGHKDLIGAKFRLNGLSKTITDTLAGTSPTQTLYLTLFSYGKYGSSNLYMPITTQYWNYGSYAGENDVFSYTASTGTFEIELNSSAVNILSADVTDELSYSYFILTFYRYDKLGDIWWGDNQLLNSGDEVMSSGNNWYELEGSLDPLHTFTLSYGYDGSSVPINSDSLDIAGKHQYTPDISQPWYDDHSDCNRMVYDIATKANSSSDTKLGMRLGKNYVNDWVDDDASYVDTNTYTTSNYTIIFDYVWNDALYEYCVRAWSIVFGLVKSPIANFGVETTESVLIINDEKMRHGVGVLGTVFNGIFTVPLLGHYPYQWRRAIHSEVLNDPVGVLESQGINLYMLYNDWGVLVANIENTASTYELLIDNFGLYKSHNHLIQQFTFELQANPLLLTYTVRDDYPLLDTVVPYDITETTFVSGGDNVDDSGSTLKTYGLIWKAGSTPTYASNDGIWEYDLYASFQPNYIHTIDEFYSGSLGTLTPNTTYYVRAFASNWSTKGTPAGYNFGSAINFTSLGVPEITTWTASNIDVFSADLTGIITSAGTISGGSPHNGPVTAAGFLWLKGSADQATLIASGNNDPSGDLWGGFTVGITLDGSYSLYTYMAYAVNATGTGYGDVETFVTPSPT